MLFHLFLSKIHPKKGFFRMITFFNKIGNSWIAKIICAALGVSMMAFWGLGGLSSSFSENDHKAITIGSDVITIDQINQQLNQERAKISALTGQDVSSQKAIEMGMVDLIVQQLIREKMLIKITDKIGLAASDEAVRKYVERNPLFQDNLGNFDANLFYAYMGKLKINQVQLSEKLKHELTQQQLTHALSKASSKNSQIIDLIVAKQKEKRQISATFLATKNINIGSPSESDLRDYYEAYQEEFMNPEYRQIQLLSISPKDFSGQKDQVYDKMYQVVQDLEDLLGEGISLEEAANKLKLHSPDLLNIDVSGQNKNNLVIDNRLADNPILQEIFTLSEGEATSITDYKDGFLVAEVEKITPTSPKSFDSVIDQVKDLWKTEQQKEKLPELVANLTNQITNTNQWGSYYPVQDIVEQNKSNHVPLELLSSIYKQKTGHENVQSYPVSNGSWIVVVDQVIHNSQPPSISEKDSAQKLYTDDLFETVQRAYTTNFNVKVNETNIKKFFSSYLKGEE